MNYRMIIVAILSVLMSVDVKARTFPAKAVCKVFVANAFNEYVSDKTRTENPDEIRRLYRGVLATNKNDAEFTRVHQILLHEIVTVVDQKGPELIVRCSDHFSQVKANQKPYCTYAVLADEFVFLEELQHAELLPPPLEWYDRKSFWSTGNIFTLGFSKKDTAQQDDFNFSPGTRFLIKEKNDQFLTVFALLPADRHQGEDQKQSCMMTVVFNISEGTINHPSTKEEKKSCALEQFWRAFGGDKRVTTVWGGRSAHRAQKFSKMDYTITELELPDHTKVTGFRRPQEDLPHRGCDAEGADGLVATICGIEKVEKNTTTDFLYHTPLGFDESIHKLDTIHGASGYLGRVISVEENLIQEIRSYSQHHGVGRIAKLSDTFEGIETYHDLVGAYRTGKPLKLWNDDKTKIIAEYPAHGPRAWSIGKFRPSYSREQWDKLESMRPE